ncbi:hypothetical protein M8C21_004535 [Ambrosia artemisiifolia]|uniref:Inactive purple acid phosphatase 16 n=1 Tax=Ambrosia artemisiifolia TaxID=4212 RepID=A0AAD5GHT5_AMBAR|nr:hypothetical protein M8C21_004535 [Ambrosia artemisiifolia]
MAHLPNSWCTITFLFFIFQNFVTVCPEHGLADDDVILQHKSITDGYLRFNGDSEGSSFKVALFADLHFGEDAWTDWGPQQDLNSVKVMSTVLDVERPVYLGDVITANNLPIHNASLYWDQAISPTRARNIPWASLFGNHDDAPFEWPIDWFSSSGIPQILCPSANASGGDKCGFKGTTRLELMSSEIRRNPLSYTRFGPQNLWPSVSNYVHTIVSPKSEHKSPLMFMYFLDSGGGSYPKVISTIQSEWFYNKSQEAENVDVTNGYLRFASGSKGSSFKVALFADLHFGENAWSDWGPDHDLSSIKVMSTVLDVERPVYLGDVVTANNFMVQNASFIPEIVFWHIPSKAYEKAAKEVAARRIQCAGSMFEEGVAAQDAEMGMMKLLKQKPSVKAIFVGHNHGLDWCCPYEKMWLCYARHTGYGGYGTWPRGARILEIVDEPFSLKSWIRMENGTLHSEVVLSN